MEDDITSKPGMTLVVPSSVDWLLVSNFDSFSAASSNVVIDLPDDDDEEPLRQKGTRKRLLARRLGTRQHPRHWSWRETMSLGLP